MSVLSVQWLVRHLTHPFRSATRYFTLLRTFFRTLALTFDLLAKAKTLA